MKTSNSHGFHGITLRNDAYGWVIQIKLMGKYRMLRSFADTPEIAARRHDVALSKLEAFTEPNAMPNFPDDFASIDISRSSFQKNDGGLDFWDEVHRTFSALCRDAEAAGLDPIEMANSRRQAVETSLKSNRQRQEFARIKFTERLFKLRQSLPSLGLSADKSKQLADMLDQTKRILDLAS